MIQLCPRQQQTFDQLKRVLHNHRVIEVIGATGSGKTTLLQYIHHHLGGELIEMYNFIDYTRQHHPLALEEAFEQMVMRALHQHDIVIIDDLQALLGACSGAYPRSGLIILPLRKLCAYATKAQKTLIVSSEVDCTRFAYVYPPTMSLAIQEFQAMDYGFFCHRFLDAVSASQLDYDKIYRFASNLNAYQLRRLCLELPDAAKADTEQFIDYLRSQQLTSNVDLGEVQAVDLSALKGIDDILQKLEANLIIPLEHDDLAHELDLKPKRGVLLAGPPGTGKTTIGRALAHRLKSKFFLIDGTFISGTGEFYAAIHEVIEAAKENAPAIVFIDDTDVIFEDGGDSGLYRYLLTLLDGLESETAGRVCVMMTAMNVSSLPPALVRSGRIELWLEMRLPNEFARTEILQSHLNQMSLALRDADIPQLVAATESFTGADLKRLIEEGKTLYAYDLVQGNALKSATEYFLEGAKIVVKNKQRYAEAEDDTQRSPSRGHRTRTSLLSDSLHQSFLRAIHQR